MSAHCPTCGWEYTTAGCRCNQVLPYSPQTRQEAEMMQDGLSYGAIQAINMKMNRVIELLEKLLLGVASQDEA